VFDALQDLKNCAALAIEYAAFPLAFVTFHIRVAMSLSQDEQRFFDLECSDAFRRRLL
jgi:hypothetical protein